MPAYDPWGTMMGQGGQVPLYGNLNQGANSAGDAMYQMQNITDQGYPAFWNQYYQPELNVLGQQAQSQANQRYNELYGMAQQRGVEGTGMFAPIQSSYLQSATQSPYYLQARMGMQGINDYYKMLLEQQGALNATRMVDPLIANVRRTGQAQDLLQGYAAVGGGLSALGYLGGGGSSGSSGGSGGGGGLGGILGGIGSGIGSIFGGIGGGIGSILGALF